MPHLHLLKRVYNDHIRGRYGIYIQGDRNGERTEVVAQKVNALGIDYHTFVDVACLLWHGFAKAKGWKYPYWNLVSSDRTFERISRMLEYAEVLSDDSEFAAAFAEELMFALDYIEWHNDGGNRPRRSVQVCMRVQLAVAEYICNMYGVMFVTSNYNEIAKEMGSAG